MINHVLAAMITLTDYYTNRSVMIETKSLVMAEETMCDTDKNTFLSPDHLPCTKIYIKNVRYVYYVKEDLKEIKKLMEKNNGK